MRRTLYEGQPYQDQPYDASPQYGPPRGHAGVGDGPRPILRRKHHWVRPAIIGAAVGGIIAAVTITVTGRLTVTTERAVGTPTSVAPVAASPPHLATTGSVLGLAGHRAGEKMTISLVKVFPHPRPATSSDAPPKGDRLYAVQFHLDNTGRVAYLGSPPNSAMLVDSVGHSYQSSLDHVTGCRSFPETEKIAVGRSVLRCIVFEVPTKARIASVWFTVASGIGAQSGHWLIRN
jgi:hypothetical protein